MADVLIHVFGVVGPAAPPPRPGCRSSGSSATPTSSRTRTPTRTTSCTSPRRLRRAPRQRGSDAPSRRCTRPRTRGGSRPTTGGPHHELLFVANSRGVHRRIVDELAPTDHDLAVFGGRWTPDLLDPRYLRGDGIPNEELATYYSAADIVLNDHWSDMAEQGFISNRLYDAAASGAFVISDNVEGIAEEFDGGVVTFETGEELHALIERYLADPEARAAHAARARAAVLARHTFETAPACWPPPSRRASRPGARRSSSPSPTRSSPRAPWPRSPTPDGPAHVDGPGQLSSTGPDACSWARAERPNAALTSARVGRVSAAANSRSAILPTRPPPTSPRSAGRTASAPRGCRGRPAGSRSRGSSSSGSAARGSGCPGHGSPP